MTEPFSLENIRQKPQTLWKNYGKSTGKTKTKKNREGKIRKTRNYFMGSQNITLLNFGVISIKFSNMFVSFLGCLPIEP